MAKRKHTPQEAMSKLRQAEAAISEGSTVAEASRMIGVSAQTLCRWLARYQGWSIDEARRLMQLQTEHTLACSESWSACRGTTTLYSNWRRAKLVSPSRRRHCVERVRAVFGVSERRACRVLGQHRSTQRRPADDRVEAEWPIAAGGNYPESD